MVNNESEFRRLLDEFEDLRRKDEIPAALARLARLEYRANDASSKLKGRIYEAIANFPLRQEQVKAIEESAIGSAEKLMRILENGGNYEFEECVLIITLRTELWLVENFLATHGFGRLPLPFAQIDQCIMELAQGSRSQAVFRSANVHVRKHGCISLIEIGLS